MVWVSKPKSATYEYLLIGITSMLLYRSLGETPVLCNVTDLQLLNIKCHFSWEPAFLNQIDNYSKVGDQCKLQYIISFMSTAFIRISFQAVVSDWKSADYKVRCSHCFTQKCQQLCLKLSNFQNPKPQLEKSESALSISTTVLYQCIVRLS